MDAHRETELKINFKKGYDIDVTIVNNNEEIYFKIFHKNTHNIEEVIDFINYNSYEHDVYF